MRVVVSCDMRSRSEGSGENERVEFSIPPLNLLRLLWCFGDRGVLSEESENAEFCLDVQIRHGEGAEDERKQAKKGERVRGAVC